MLGSDSYMPMMQLSKRGRNHGTQNSRERRGCISRYCRHFDGGNYCGLGSYVWAASFLEQGESAPIATFFVQEGSDGIYHVDVIKVSKQENLAAFSFYLKDETGSTYVGQGHGFGEVAMQIIGGEEHGIDTAYGGDDQQLLDRRDNISADDGTDYPVSFNDNDRDGKLSAGDQFMVYGSGNAANGPASDNWRLDIQFDASGDIIGSAKML